MAYKRGGRTFRPLRRRGMGVFGLTTVDQLTGNLIDSGTNTVIGNCGNLTDWLFYMDCWGVSPATWKNPLGPVQNNYVPPPAPTTAQVNAALTCPDPTLSPEDCASLIGQQADALVQALTNQSIAATQAANLAQVNADNPNGGGLFGCDSSSDVFGCLGGLAWYWWALLAAGGTVLIVSTKR